MALPSNRAIAFMCDTLAGMAVLAIAFWFAIFAGLTEGGFVGLLVCLGLAYVIGLVRGLIDFRHVPEEQSDG